jgi:hypothetical protein
MSCSRAFPVIFGLISTDRYDPSGNSSSTGSRSADPARHNSTAPVSAAARQPSQL